MLGSEVGSDVGGLVGDFVGIGVVGGNVGPRLGLLDGCLDGDFVGLNILQMAWSQSLSDDERKCVSSSHNKTIDTTQ